MRVIESKSTVLIPQEAYLLFCGTIAKPWGIFEAIDLWEKLNEVRSIVLVIAGYAPRKGLLQQVEERLASSPYSDRVKFIGGSAPVPYTDIVELIRHCTFGTAFYHPLPHLRDKIPTKFYEFMALGRPLVFTSSGSWEDFNKKFSIGISRKTSTIRELKSMEIKRLWEEITTWEAPVLEEEVYSWEREAAELKKLGILLQ